MMRPDADTDPPILHIPLKAQPGWLHRDTSDIINAILDALAPRGIEHIDMPATPERVWRAIRSAYRG